MKAKKIIASVLTGVMLLSLTACSGSSKKYEKAFKDLGYEEMEEWDMDDIEDDMDDGLYYSSKDEKEIKKMCKYTQMNGLKAKNVASVSWGVRDDDDGYFVVYSITFKNKSEAEKVFDKTVKSMEKSYKASKEYYDKDQIGQDDGDDFYAYGYVRNSGGGFHEIFMSDSKTVTYIDASFYEADDVYDDYEAFYEAIGRDCPTDLVKDEIK